MSKLVKVERAAREVGNSASSLRRYDVAGLYPTRRDKNNHRVYSESDLVELRKLAETRHVGRPRKVKP